LQPEQCNYWQEKVPAFAAVLLVQLLNADVAVADELLGVVAATMNKRFSPGNPAVIGANTLST
jgi:hypothetical protein